VQTTKLISQWWQEPGAGDQALEDSHKEFWDDFIANGIDVDFTAKKILDFGCNQGGLLSRIHELMPYSEAVGVDLAQLSIDSAKIRRQHLPIKFFATDNLNSLETDFDYAMSSAVIYLIQDMRNHAKQIFDRLKPGGIYFAWHADYITDKRYAATQEAINRYAAIECAQNTVDDIIAAFQSEGFKVYVKRMIPPSYIPVPIREDERWFSSAQAEIDYWYEHRYVFRCVKP
jgi:2-polyprenyl-3-methyl-5-hydroxy-6-metoxy-1,4-benzoquinol methylase